MTHPIRAMQPDERHLLLTTTSLATGSGKEDGVMDHIRASLRAQDGWQMRQDVHGNLFVHHPKLASPDTAPWLIVAHTDHPAFVVQSVTPALTGGVQVTASFRGGVNDRFFLATPVRKADANPAQNAGTIESILPRSTQRWWGQDAVIHFPKQVDLKVGDLLIWDLPASSQEGSRLHAPACDNLVSVAAALLLARRLLADVQDGIQPCNVQWLFTRAEEVGFVGAIGACLAQTVDKNAAVVVLENSRAQPHAGLGQGPVIRVGDRSSIFDPCLTYHMVQCAQQIDARRADTDEAPSWRWQRALMTGGVCEATAFLAFGYRAGCLCLPMEHYHNMNERTGHIDREIIDLQDFANLLILLTAICLTPMVCANQLPGRDRMETLWQQRRSILPGHEDA